MNKIEWLNHIEQVIAQGPYKASMFSLKRKIRHLHPLGPLLRPGFWQ